MHVAITAASLYAGIRIVTPGHWCSGPGSAACSSSPRKSGPPETRSAAVHTGYRATNARRISAASRIPFLLANATLTQEDKADRRDHGGDQSDQQAELDRGAVVQHPGDHDERHDPEERAERDANQQALARRRTERLEADDRRLGIVAHGH